MDISGHSVQLSLNIKQNGFPTALQKSELNCFNVLCSKCVISRSILLKCPSSKCVFDSIAKSVVIGYLRNVESTTQKHMPTQLCLIITKYYHVAPCIVFKYHFKIISLEG
eukprot:516714_1